MKLITEANFDDIITEKTLEESIDNTPAKKSYYIKGIFMQGNLKNRNGRIYPVHILEREATRYNRDYINKDRGLGELGHPKGPTINLDRSSHKFLDLHQDGNNWIGRARIMEHLPMGKIAAGLLDEGVKFGVSTRGVGSIKNVNGQDVVGEDFYLATPGDIVSDPSAPQAFVNGIYEMAEWVWDNGLLVEQVIQQHKDILDTALNEENILKAFNDFMKSIR